MEYQSSPPPYYAYRRHQRKRVTTRMEILKESLKTVGREYCTESSICGLKHLVDESTPYIERIIWKLTLIGALAGSVTLVWMTFMKYYNAPLVTTQLPEGVSVNKIIFPAIGICSNNRISKRAATELARNLLKEERNKIYNEADMLQMLFGLGLLYDYTIEFQKYTPMQLHHVLGQYDVQALLRGLTPKCEDLLVRCAWNEIPRKCTELFDFRLTMNGYCCTFNYLRHSDIFFRSSNTSSRSIDMYQYGNKSSFDFDQGLKVLLRLNESDDFYYNMPLQGAQLQFSDAYDFPDSPSGSFAMQIISPNVQMSVSVTASFTEASRDIQHVPVKLRQCLFYDESPYLQFYTHSDCMLKCLMMSVSVTASFTEASRDIQHVPVKLRQCLFYDESPYLQFYTHSDCMLKCRMLFLLKNCNCTPFNMPKMATARTCDMRDVACLRIYYVQSITARPNVDNVPPELELEKVGGGLLCPMCYPTCSKTAYNYYFNNVNIFPEQLNMVPDSDRNDWLQGANFTGTSIVHVKYGREVADCYGQNVIMKWFDLISNIGSTCGFLTGFSFVSVLEFIYFFTVKLFREIKRRRRKNRIVTSLDTHPSQFEKNIHRYRPIYWNELRGSTRGSSVGHM